MRGSIGAAFAAAIGFVSLLPWEASAAVIFDQTPNLATGTDSETNLLADDFQLQSGANTITDVHWWGVYAFGDTPTEPDDFTIRIFADISGTPDTNPLHTFAVGNSVVRTDSGTDVFGFNIYTYSIAIPALTLSAGATY